MRLGKNVSRHALRKTRAQKLIALKPEKRTRGNIFHERLYQGWIKSFYDPFSPVLTDITVPLLRQCARGRGRAK